MSKRKKKKPEFCRDDYAPTQETVATFNKGCGTHFSLEEMKAMYNAAVDLLDNGGSSKKENAGILEKIMSNKISNKKDAERLDAEIETLLLKWMREGESVQEVALALQRASITLFVGHGFTPEFLGEMIRLGAENQQATMIEVQQERDDEERISVCHWKDTEQFSSAAQ